MRCAVVDQSGAVLNVIVADPDRDQVPSGKLVSIPAGSRTEPGDLWSSDRGFHKTPEKEAILEEQRIAHEEKIRRGERLNGR